MRAKTETQIIDEIKLCEKWAKRFELKESSSDEEEKINLRMAVEFTVRATALKWAMGL